MITTTCDIKFITHGTKTLYLFIYPLVNMENRLKDIKAAASRIHPYIPRTPVVTSSTLYKLVGRQCYFKCEDFQKNWILQT